MHSGGPVPGFDSSLDELECELNDELRIPPTEDLQVYELHRMFGL